MTARTGYMTFLVAAAAAIIFAITRVENWGILCLLVLALALIGAGKDAKAISWGQFMPLGIVVLFVFFLIYHYANPMWHRVVGYQTANLRHIFQWNDIFNSIPFNDARYFRFWQPDWLTTYFQWVYNYGFALSYWICVIRAFFTKDVQKFGRYSLAGYLLQVPLILPFYNLVLLQEVWFVQGTPDLLERALTPEQQFSTTMNCFPSMHTSIAFAAFLLAMREKSAWYRWWIGTYCISIIVSTMYLKIHWIIDVFAGMAFAYGCVKLADWIVGTRLYASFTAWFEGLGGRLQERFMTPKAPQAAKPVQSDQSTLHG
ncbi:phosphatase PAP2 family protein [Paenibacillus hemerocallicola]|uniref:Phosphatase PAP2 family protein n=1 Tax=Paenibacillus hemerocallicola TaxID=1172614 RepID=A0A5C4T336_9BACL|nr:phosphatase PAP2 family protein [Paenibacillus hemerocallicola]TNJ63472.1 phosphatase PAP2 family protein [Paenibacillus hemerocallicola]